MRREYIPIEEASWAKRMVELDRPKKIRNTAQMISIISVEDLINHCAKYCTNCNKHKPELWKLCNIVRIYFKNPSNYDFLFSEIIKHNRKIKLKHLLS